MLKVFKDKAFLREFFRIAFPVMIQNFTIFLISLLDNIMVGSVSNTAVSAVFAANQVSFMFFILAWGVISGAGIMMQQFAGARDIRNLRAIFLYKIIVMTIFSVIVIPLSYFLGEKIIWFYCHSDQNAMEILKLGKEYLFLINLAFIPFGYSIVIVSSFREIGKIKYPMFASLGALMVNASLNAIFIYQLKWGVVGVAYATIIARVTEFIILIIALIMSRQQFAHISLKDDLMERSLLTMVLRKSWPLFLNEILWVSGMVMISLAYAQRDSVLSTLSVVSTMSDIFGIVFQGLSVGIGIMVGNQLGRNEIERVKKATFNIYVLGIAISVVLGLIMIGLSPFIPMMFSKISSAQKVQATKLIIVFGACMWAFSMCTCGYNVLKAGGKSLLTFILDSGFMWVAVVPIAWVLSVRTNADLLYIYLAVQSIDIIKAIIGVIIIKRGTWAKNLISDFQSKSLKNV